MRFSFLTAGLGNTGVGWYSLFSNATGNFNTGVGGGALALNNADSNTAVGAAALLLNTAGSNNTAVGTDAMVFNDMGSENTAVGSQALFSNTTAVQNTATGAGALFSHLSGNSNTANGANALFSDVSGQINTATGAFALFSNTTGTFNTANGDHALFSNTTEGFNTAVGAEALFSNTGGDNTAVGAEALQGNTSGTENVAIGVSALVTNQTGNRNIALGSFAGHGLTTGSDNIYIGYNITAPAPQSNACYITSIWGQTTPAGIPVYINANQRLGTMTSSKRFKEDIQPMDKASDVLFALKPVTFHYKKEIDPAGQSQFGLVAEEVEKVNPDLIVRDKEGKPYSVRYDQVNAMLLNEFLKEHREVQEQQAMISQLKKNFGVTIAQLTARLDEQAAQIQKVNAQLELSKAVPQTVLNNQ